MSHSKVAISFLIIYIMGFTLSPTMKVRPSSIETYEPKVELMIIRSDPPRYSKSISEDRVSLTLQGTIEQYILEIVDRYPNLEPELISSIIWRESRYNPSAKNYNGTCVGLMQVSTKWHTKRAYSLGVTDLTDPYGNILTGCDLLSELLDLYPLPMALMVYHGGTAYAHNLYSKGIVDDYTKDILFHAQQLKEVT